MSQPDFNPFDPISAAMGAMHGQNLLAAKDARIKQLEDEVERLNLLTAEMDKTINASQAGYRLLKAEVERLTDANG